MEEAQDTILCSVCDKVRIPGDQCDRDKNGYCAAFLFKAKQDAKAVGMHKRCGFDTQAYEAEKERQWEALAAQLPDPKPDMYDLQEEDLKNIKNNGHSNNQ